MRKLVTAVICAAFLTLGCAKQWVDWTSVASKLALSTAEMQDERGRGFCSAFVIDAERNIWGTAAHCVTEQIDEETYVSVAFQVDTVSGEILWVDIDLDAAAFRAETARPALCAAAALPQIGEPVASYGFALEDDLGAHFRVGVVSSIEKLFGQTYIFFDNAGIGGMSGGPYVNRAGQVVSINQISDRVRHFAGQPIQDILAGGMQEFWAPKCSK